MLAVINNISLSSFSESKSFKFTVYFQGVTPGTGCEVFPLQESHSTAAEVTCCSAAVCTKRTGGEGEVCKAAFTVPELQLLYRTNTAVYVVQRSTTFTSLINTKTSCVTQRGACFYPVWFSNSTLYYIYKTSVFCLFSLHDKQIFWGLYWCFLKFGTSVLWGWQILSLSLVFVHKL